MNRETARRRSSHREKKKKQKGGQDKVGGPQVNSDGAIRTGMTSAEKQTAVATQRVISQALAAAGLAGPGTGTANR